MPNAIKKYSKLKVNLSHDWLNGMRGGEKCLEEMIKLFPDNEIYTLLHDKGKLSALIEARPIRVSALQKFPKAIKYYKHYLPFFKKVVESMRMRDCDLIISTNHCVAKAYPKPRYDTKHICYCFTPMRYAWLFYDEYFGHFPKIIQLYLKHLLKKLQVWDRENSQSVTHFIAISHHIKKRIKDFYNRDAAVIYPPVDTDFYKYASAERKDYVLVVSALVPYKRVDLAIEASVSLGKKIVVIGTGPELDRLKQLASPETEFLGWCSNEDIRKRYNEARYLIFPGEEDFGIVPVEAQACGLPVIALAKGGALETVEDQVSGVFFNEQSKDSIAEAIRRADKIQWDCKQISKNAQKFSEERFREEMKLFVEKSMGLSNDKNMNSNANGLTS